MRGGRTSLGGLMACIVVAMLAAVGATTAGAAFPGGNGKIAFVRSPGMEDEEILTIDPSGQNAVALTDDTVFEDNPAYSPDGEQIVFTRGAGTGSEIFVMDADGQNQVRLVEGPSVSEPAFSPDGKRIVFRRYDGNDGEIVVMDANGQNQVPLTDNSVDDQQPIFSPDGQRIVFSRFDGADYELFAMDADGQNQVPLTDSSADDVTPDVSPDGLRIVFTRIFGFNGAEIFAMDADGQNPTPLTANSVNDADPVFSPDGQQILFVRTSAMDNYELFTMDPSGQDQAPFPYSPVYDDSPSWQPLNPPALDLSGPAKQKSVKTIPVTVVSQNEDATVTIGGTVSAPKPKKRAAASKSKAFDLPPRTVELQPGQPVVVELAVPKKARKLLKKAFAAGKKGKAAITATATDDLGASSEDSHAVKLKKKPKKK